MPSGWEEHVSRSRSASYFFNRVTGESRSSRPSRGSSHSRIPAPLNAHNTHNHARLVPAPSIIGRWSPPPTWDDAVDVARPLTAPAHLHGTLAGPPPPHARTHANARTHTHTRTRTRTHGNPPGSPPLSPISLGGRDAALKAAPPSPPTRGDPPAGCGARRPIF
jgi:hypothetical protein